MASSDRLSVIDAFFVAYHEASDALMQFGCALTVRGELKMEALTRVMAQAITRWPQLNQRVKTLGVGLGWVEATSPQPPSALIIECDTAQQALDGINRSIDPFKEAPFRLYVHSQGDEQLIVFVAHHALMDGEGLFGVSRYMSHALASELTGERPRHQPVEFFPKPRERAEASGGSWVKTLSKTWRYKQWMAQESVTPRGVTMCLRSLEPGAVRSHSIWIEHLEDHEEAARQAQVKLTWLAMAAWAKALHLWNVDRGESSKPIISLEVPVSLRAALNDPTSMGNHVSPLLLLADASLPIDELAIELRRQLSEAIADEAHKAVPLWSAPGALLPWAIFKKVAVDPRNTGSATSHFVWIEAPRPLQDDLEPSLKVEALTLYTPVCMEMGVAFCAVRWPDKLQVALTYRDSALHGEDVEQLAQHWLAALEGAR